MTDCPHCHPYNPAKTTVTYNAGEKALRCAHCERVVHTLEKPARTFIDDETVIMDDPCIPRVQPTPALVGAVPIRPPLWWRIIDAIAGIFAREASK